MRVRLTEIRLRPTGKKARLDRDVDVESLFVGRGPDNDLSLKGLTISLHHATIRQSNGRIYIEAASGKEINVNGLVTTGERLAVGDRIRIGSWEIRALEADTNMDLSLEYEEIDRADSERAALDARTKLGIEVGAMARRPLSWVAVGLIFALFLVIPFLWPPAQVPWTTGGVSKGHAYIETECQECHSGLFRPVQNSDCMTCHYDTGRHAPVEVQAVQLESAACADCHLEHRGREASLADRGANFCADCHSDMAQVVESTELRPVSDFGTDHPTFKLAVVIDASEPPVSVEISEDLEEDSGLGFNHYMHVGGGVTNADDEDVLMRCGDCHQQDAGGFVMKPIGFEEHCQSCHRLDFDERAPTEQAPHDDSGNIRAYIREFYWTRVLSGQITDETAPGELRRRAPGGSLTNDESILVRQWVDSKLIDAENRFYGRSGTCKTCHSVEPGAASDGGMGIATVQLQNHWTPDVGFKHDSHSPFACAKCHPAAAVFDPDADVERPEWSLASAVPYALIEESDDTPISETSSDILIPSIETCRECHGGADASGHGIVPSPCSMCHPFHAREFGTMQ